MKTLILLSSVLFGATFGAVLDCTQIPEDQIQPENVVAIPANSTEPVPIPPNFNCVFNVKVQPNMYAHVTLTNQLKGGNDVITVRDAQGKRILVTSRSGPGDIDFYVFPNTTSTFQVTTKSADNGSKFRMTVRYREVRNPLVNYMKTGVADLKYYYLNHMQLRAYYQPINVVGDQKIVLTIAQSYWKYDLFSNYYIVDGDMNHNHGVYHMSDFVGRHFVSTGNNLTVMGMDDRVSHSSVIFTPLSEFSNYDGFDGITTYFEAQSVTVNAIEAHQNALTVISHYSNQTTLLNMNYSDSNPSCSIQAVSTPPTPDSVVYQDLRQIDVFPHHIPHKKFAIIVKNCSPTFTMVSPTTED